MTKLTTKYKFKTRYPQAYKALEEALVNYALDHDMPEMNPIEAAKDVISFCNNTFSYVSNHQQRIVEFLQGLGLGIPYSNYEILELCEKDGFINENTKETVKQRYLDNYWSFMAMRLIHISEGKMVEEVEA